jgi:hypothetical protein
VLAEFGIENDGSMWRRLRAGAPRPAPAVGVATLAFRTAAPFGKTWEAFAAAEILLALNAASRSPRDHRRPAARREPYEIER